MMMALGAVTVGSTVYSSLARYMRSSRMLSYCYSASKRMIQPQPFAVVVVAAARERTTRRRVSSSSTSPVAVTSAPETNGPHQQPQQQEPPPPVEQWMVDAWLDHAMHTVREHDSHIGSYWAGKYVWRHHNYQQQKQQHLLRTAHYAARSFWIETGLRLGSTAQVPVNSTPSVHLDFWQQGIHAVFEQENQQQQQHDMTHPTLLLLRHLKREQRLPWTKCHFDDLIQGRRNDLYTTQYSSLEQLTQHAEQTCGSVVQLVLESGGLSRQQNPAAHEAARLVGRTHGLTMQLRQSIPILSTQGRLVIPSELTAKHGVQSPRYLLSALGLGDETCRLALAHAVQDVAAAAAQHLAAARALRSSVLQEPHGTTAAMVLLAVAHTVPCQAFLDRLQQHHYQLTDRNLRSVGILEQVTTVARVVAAYHQDKY